MMQSFPPNLLYIALHMLACSDLTGLFVRGSSYDSSFGVESTITQELWPLLLKLFECIFGVPDPLQNSQSAIEYQRMGTKKHVTRDS